MPEKLLRSPSPQAMDIYRLLEVSGSKSAKEIGVKLKIFPHGVYRAVKQLLALGFAEEIHSYPVKFIARPNSQALELFLGATRQSFGSAFGKNHQPHIHKLLPLSFVQRRQDLLKMTSKDTNNAKSTINYIASGLDVPAETILANQRAVERGVKVRLIAQNLKEVTEEKLRSWQKAGVEVRHYPNIEARIFVFDGQIVYFTSYDPNNMHEALGMRFNYPPYAQMMSELFEQRWKLAKELTGF